MTATTAARALSYDAANGLLTLRVGKRADYYLMDVTRDGATVTVSLTKAIGTYDADEDGTYAVTVGADGLRACNCKGHQYRGRCKHADAIAKLASLGKV